VESSPGTPGRRTQRKSSDWIEHRRVFYADRLQRYGQLPIRSTGQHSRLEQFLGRNHHQLYVRPLGNVTVSGSANANLYQFTGRENDSNGCISIALDTIARPFRDSSLRIRSGSGVAARICMHMLKIPRSTSAILLDCGPFSSFGLIIDGQENVGFYGTVGGSIGTGAGGGLSLSAGINLQWSNGGCIKDFRGLFFETIGSVGGVSGDASGGRIAKSAGCRWWRCVWSRRRVQADNVRPRRQVLFHWEIYLMCSKDSVGRERLGAIRMFELILLLIFSSQR
jgi:hypothetical protein